MNQPLAATGKPVSTSIDLPELRLWENIRFVTGVVITLGGAGVFLSDLISLIPSFG